MKSLALIRARLEAARTKSVPPFPTLAEHHDLADDIARLIQALEKCVEQRDTELSDSCLEYSHGKDIYDRTVQDYNAELERILNGEKPEGG